MTLSDQSFSSETLNAIFVDVCSSWQDFNWQHILWSLCDSRASCLVTWFCLVMLSLCSSGRIRKWFSFVVLWIDLLKCKVKIQERTKDWPVTEWFLNPSALTTLAIRFYWSPFMYIQTLWDPTLFPLQWFY